MSSWTCALCGSPELRPGRAGLWTCRACGLAGAYPLPLADELRALYVRDYYEAWGRTGGEDPEVRAMKKATFAPRLKRLGPLPSGARILDIGCATGSFLDLVQDSGAEPHGVEISPYAAGVAEARHPGRVVEGTLEDAVYPDGHFFAVFMSDLIEHVLHPDALLARVFRLVQPGGHVVICTPDLGSLSARLMGRKWFHRKPEHILYFTASSLRTALAGAGFREVRFQRGVKTMTVRYLASHFRTYRLFAVSPVLNVLERVLPARLSGCPVALPSGEIVAWARKPDDRETASRSGDQAP